MAFTFEFVVCLYHGRLAASQSCLEQEQVRACAEGEDEGKGEMERERDLRGA